MPKLFKKSFVGYNENQVNKYVKNLRNANMNLRIKNSKLADRNSSLIQSKAERKAKAEAIGNSIVTAEQIAKGIKNKSEIKAKAYGKKAKAIMDKKLANARKEQHDIVAENYNLRQDIKDLRNRAINFLHTSISALKDTKWQKLSAKNKVRVFKHSFDLINQQSRNNILKQDKDKQNNKTMVTGEFPNSVVFNPDGSSRKF